MLGLLGEIFPSLIALSFVPSCISTIPYIHNQILCFWSITGLLITISAYIVLYLITHSILPPMLRKLYLRTEAVELQMSFFQETLDSDDKSFIEARKEVLHEISSMYKESKKLLHMSVPCLHALQYTRGLFQYDQWLHAIIFILSLENALLLLILDKTADFEHAGLAQLYYTLWVLVFDAVIAVLLPIYSEKKIEGKVTLHPP